MFYLTEILDLAIQIEENGETFYRNAVKKISHPPLRSMLQWLADQEVNHREWFANKKEGVETGEHDPRLQEIGIDILKNVLGDQSFSLKETDPSKIDSEESLLQLAIEFEKDTILFFEMIAAFVEDDEISKGLHSIIEEENRHIQLLRDYEGEDDSRV